METPPHRTSNSRRDIHLGKFAGGVVLGVMVGLAVALVAGFFVLAAMHSNVSFGLPGIFATVVVVGVVLWGLWWGYKRTPDVFGPGDFGQGFVIGLMIATLLGGTCISVFYGSF